MIKTRDRQYILFTSTVRNRFFEIEGETVNAVMYDLNRLNLSSPYIDVEIEIKDRVVYVVITPDPDNLTELLTDKIRFELGDVRADETVHINVYRAARNSMEFHNIMTAIVNRMTEQLAEFDAEIENYDDDKDAEYIVYMDDLRYYTQHQTELFNITDEDLSETDKMLTDEFNKKRL